MSVLLERFGSLSLPLIEAQQEIGSGGVRTSYANLPGGGAFDAYGDDRAPRSMYTLRARGEIGNGETQAEMLAEWNALWLKNRTRDKLYRRTDDGDVQWAWARLRVTPPLRRPEHVLFLPVELLFDVVSPVWYGDRHGSGWTLDSGEYLDTGLTLDEASDDYTITLTGGGAVNTLEVTNHGTATVENAVVTITAPGGGAITGFDVTLQHPYPALLAYLTFTGTIAAGTSLVIDAGSQTVLNDGTDAYDSLTFHATHAIGGWLEFRPGATTFTIEQAGLGGGTATIVFADAYE